MDNETLNDCDHGMAEITTHRGERLQEIRDMFGLSLSQCAKMSGIDRDVLVEIEAGRELLDGDNLQKLSKLLHVAPAYFDDDNSIHATLDMFPGLLNFTSRDVDTIAAHLNQLKHSTAPPVVKDSTPCP